MKKSVLTVLFALFCTMSFAQLSFNVKAGLNLSSYIGDNSDHSKFKPGVRLGVRKVQSIRKDTKVSWMLMQM